MQPNGTVWKILEGNNPGITSLEFSRITISGSGEEVVWSFPNIIPRNIVTPGAGSILTPVALFEQL